MGEYAWEQMAADAQRLFGGKWDAADFDETPMKKLRPVCPKCGKKFVVQHAVRDHLRDKHGVIRSY